MTSERMLKTCIRVRGDFGSVHPQNLSSISWPMVTETMCRSSQSRYHLFLPRKQQRNGRVVGVPWNTRSTNGKDQPQSAVKFGSTGRNDIMIVMQMLIFRPVSRLFSLILEEMAFEACTISFTVKDRHRRLKYNKGDRLSKGWRTVRSCIKTGCFMELGVGVRLV